MSNAEVDLAGMLDSCRTGYSFDTAALKINKVEVDGNTALVIAHICAC